MGPLLVVVAIVVLVSFVVNITKAAAAKKKAKEEKYADCRRVGKQMICEPREAYKNCRLVNGVMQCGEGFKMANEMLRKRVQPQSVSNVQMDPSMGWRKRRL